MVLREFNKLMTEYLLFVGATIFIATALVVFTQYKTGKSIKKGARDGILFFLLFGVVVGSLTLCSEVEATELEWFAYGEIYLGLDVTSDSPSPFCEPSSGFNNGSHDRLTSNGGVRGNIIRYGAFQLNGKFTHHSGATCDDEPTYNAIGVEAVLTLW